MGFALAIVMVAAFRVFALGPDVEMLAVVKTTLVNVLVAYPLYTLGATIMIRLAPDRVPLALRLALGCLVASPVIALLTPLVGWLLNAMQPFLEPEESRAWIFAFIAERYPHILIMAMLTGLPLWLLINVPWYKHLYGVQDVLATPSPRAPEVSAERSATDAEHPPRFVAKLPHEKRGPVWAVTAEQHYLRVYTTRGDDLVLMRFSDALDELRAYEGLQIHRSHWVAAAGCDGLETQDKRLFVCLRNGVKLPVSRPNYAAAKAFFSLESIGGGEAVKA